MPFWMMERGTFVLSSSRVGPQVGADQSMVFGLSNSRLEGFSMYVRGLRGEGVLLLVIELSVFGDD